jgi:hypothetical protein
MPDRARRIVRVLLLIVIILSLVVAKGCADFAGTLRCHYLKVRRLPSLGNPANTK